MMGLRYKKVASYLSDEEAHEAAMATWGTDWSTDPAPRTLDAAYEEVDGDLECWGED
jgi:hypothetical protein